MKNPRRGSCARRAAAAGTLATVAIISACASSRERIILEPGVQPVGAEVDHEAGLVTVERDGVVVSVQAAMLPPPHGEALHPTFWVTVSNQRDEKISLRPADARLVDTFGNQLAPVPMSVDRGGSDVRYALVDPEIRTYVGLNFGWPYYPLYPYRGWFAHPRLSRARYWHYDPFWTLGLGPIWIQEIRAAPATRSPARDLERIETIHRGAKVTWVVVFPEIGRDVRDVRLIVPDVRTTNEGVESTLDFEVIFEQIVVVDGH